MDVRYINPFIDSIKDVFSTMLSADIVISKARIKARDERNADVSAIIGFSGQAEGAVALCFPSRTAVVAASKFAGIEITQDHPDFGDALGELASMVAGGAKSKLDDFNINISLPRVVAGTDMPRLDFKNSPILVLPCDSTLGRFAAEVSMVLDKTRPVARGARVAPAQIFRAPPRKATF